MIGGGTSGAVVKTASSLRSFDISIVSSSRGSRIFGSDASVVWLLRTGAREITGWPGVSLGRRRCIVGNDILMYQTKKRLRLFLSLCSDLPKSEPVSVHPS